MEEETMESFPVALSSNLHENSEGDRDFSLVLFTQEHQLQTTHPTRFTDLEDGTKVEDQEQENKVQFVKMILKRKNKKWFSFQLRCPSLSVSCYFDYTILKYALILICALC